MCRFDLRWYRLVQAAIATLQAEGKTDLAAKAAKVAKGTGILSRCTVLKGLLTSPSKRLVPTFIWITQRSDVPKIGPILYDAKSIQTSTGKAQAVQLVVYNLPDRLVVVLWPTEMSSLTTRPIV